MLTTIKTIFYSELGEDEGGPIDITGLPIASSILVTDLPGLDIDRWADHMKKWPASAIIPPYDPMDPAKTSRCADMARARLDKVGVVVAGTSDREREEFFMWAQENDFAPIVLLPHRVWDRSRQIAQLHTMRALKDKTWVHLPEPVDGFNENSWPGVYTTGEEFVRQV